MPKVSDDINAFLGKGTEFHGQLRFDGTVRVDGVFQGEIQATGTLVVGEGGRVEAEVRCGTLIIHGEVNGNVQASHRVEALAPARIMGNIQTPVLVINEGVVFEGNVRMEPPAEGSGERDKKIPFFGKREKRTAAEGVSQGDGQ
jgi:cytoskeletal protein CcmA (bactofilin family)